MDAGNNHDYSPLGIVSRKNAHLGASGPARGNGSRGDLLVISDPKPEHRASMSRHDAQMGIVQIGIYCVSAKSRLPI